MTRISEIQDRVDAATPGPWENFPLDWRCVVDPHNDSICDLHTGGEIADATFIAYARSDVPYLLAEVARYREALTKIVNGDDYISSTIAYDALSEGGGDMSGMIQESIRRTEAKALSDFPLLPRVDATDDDGTSDPCDIPGTPGEDDWHPEDASVEVWRWGRSIRLAIRSRQSVGKCIELSLDDAQSLAERLISTMNADRRKVRDEPQA